tara:strand:- start:5707 stop:6471 length:765 start_codon:yes stop_codon:yes gene_type:complete
MIKIRNCFPEFLKKVLWGNRSRWGLEIDYSDPCWSKWEDEKLKFYQQNQRKGIGAVVNDAGYEVMSGINLEGKRVLEIGAGDIRHHKFWNGAPKEYILADVHDGMMQQAKAKLDSLGIPYRAIEVERNAPLDFEASSIDLILSFYSLEHLNPLSENLLEMKRLLKPGGLLIGAIPSEGGLLWGLGRFLTSRRWLRKNTDIDPDKIICWEHPNFADEIISQCDETFKRDSVSAWPLAFAPILDANLVYKLIYRKE